MITEELLLDKIYDPKAIESKWYNFWEKSGFFRPENREPTYSIVIPPPNVTGSLHMGHAFQDTLMDILIRHKRMQGYGTLWQVGVDHAGIATQMVVERQLDAQGKNRVSLGREEFVQRVWAWKEESGGRITQQIRRLGASVDWENERFTMDEGLSHAVREVFIRLYNEGLIYRGQRLVNWDPVLGTALSDLEVESSEEDGSLWQISYAVKDSTRKLVVATTRPETLLGDVAIAVNPEDPRYQDLIGKTAILPLVGRELKIIADAYVDPQFGTGCVKITPAHDFNDYEIALRHELPLINIFTLDARLNKNVPEIYQGLDRVAARSQILTDLRAQNYLVKEEAYKIKIPRGDRSQAIIEPLLTDQWYVKIKPLADLAIQAVEERRIKFVPENWENTFFAWMRDIQDWCISRQLWWGHRIPVWYDQEDKVYVGHSEAEVRAKYNLAAELELRQDEDVLDTWFSSALWPFSSLGWPDQLDRVEKFYPNNVLVTGFDIIFFWVARMMMMGLKFMDQVPFHEVYVHGLVRDRHGQKMSKTKGNVLDPLDIIDGISLDALLAQRSKSLINPKQQEKILKETREDFPEGIPAFGADALRFAFCALATQGRNINFDLQRLTGYRNFCNKLWNAARYAMMHLQDLEAAAPIELTSVQQPINRWIISVLQSTIKNANQHLAEYRFDLYAQELYEFVWYQYCDWYLELTKPLLQENDLKIVQETKQVLGQVLETILRLLHPVIPFITEEIWQRLNKIFGFAFPSLMKATYPEAQDNLLAPELEKEINFIKEFIITVRNLRAEIKIPLGNKVSILLRNGQENEREIVAKYQQLFAKLANIKDLKFLDPAAALPLAVTALVGDLEILLPLGEIDLQAELLRLNKEAAKLENEILRSQNKLVNENFIAKAPENLVQIEREKLANYQAALDKIQAQISKLRGEQS